MRIHQVLVLMLVMLVSGCAMSPTQQQKIAADKRAINQCLSIHWLKMPDLQHAYSCRDHGKHERSECYKPPPASPDIGDIMQQCP